MVGTKLRTLKWSGINLTACGGVNTDRCLSKGLGGNMQWNLNRGNVVCSGNEKPHKFLELLIIKLAAQTFSKISKQKAIHLQVLDNMLALTYLLKMGDTQNFKLVLLEIWDHLF